MVGGARVGGGFERGAQQGFGGPVVGGCVEGVDAEVEGASDDLVGGQGEGVFVVLVVEGCGAADEGREGR